MDEPKPDQFGLSAKELHSIERRLALLASNEVGIAWMEVVLPKGKGCLPGLIGALLVWTVLWPFLLVGLVLTPLINMVLRAALRRAEAFARYAKYKEAVELFRRLQETFWRDLLGHQFEAELATLFRRFGYAAHVTPGSGDRGVDINLSKNDRRIVVQCKQHGSPAGPALVRELVGTLVTEAADGAILACTSGFTRGAIEAASGRPILLLNLDAILELQRLAAEPDAATSDEPVPLRQLRT